MADSYIDSEENVGEDIWVKVIPDEYPSDPRGDDQLGYMFCWHPNYNLGDEQFKGGDADGARDMREVAEYLVRDRKALNLIPLFLYDHSGISMRPGATITDIPSEDDVSARGKNPWDSAGWDTSMVGYIYTTEELIEMTGAPRDDIDRQLRGEVEEYSAYLEGNVWVFVVERRHCDDRDCPHNEELESIGGFYDSADALSEGKSEAKSFLQRVPQGA
jgi:hypothetical protein